MAGNRNKAFIDRTTARISQDYIVVKSWLMGSLFRFDVQNHVLHSESLSWIDDNLSHARSIFIVIIDFYDHTF